MKLLKLTALALGALTLGMSSCSKEDEFANVNGNSRTSGQITNFELGAKMGEVEFLPLANNTTPKGNSEEDMRATLHSKAAPSEGDQWVTTSYKVADFGVGSGKINARWGVLLGAAKTVDAKSCTAATATEITTGPVTENTIWYNENGAQTINSQSLKMYCQTGAAFGNNVNKCWMCLDGKPGSDTDDTEMSKQYFKIGGEADPNHEITGLAVAGGEKQDGRHIPVMTDVRNYFDFKQKEDGSQADAKFAPRGSLIALLINNKLGSAIKLKAIVVAKDNNALDFSGYFDFNVDTTDPIVRAKFVAQYPGSAPSALVFPVTQDAKVNIGIENPETMFYVWGIQKETMKGKPFRVQLRYELSGKEYTSRTFRVYPAKTQSQLTATSVFEEGKAYKTILHLDAIQQKGGSSGTDWSEGENYAKNIKLNAVNPLALVAKYDIAKVAEPIAIDGRRQLKFVKENKVKNDTDYTHYDAGVDVGFYTWPEAMRLFGYDVDDKVAVQYKAGGTPEEGFNDAGYKKGSLFDQLNTAQFKEIKYQTIDGQDYYIPTINELRAITPPYITPGESAELQTKNPSPHLQLIKFNNAWDYHLLNADGGIRRIGQTPNRGFRTGLDPVQIGEITLQPEAYYDEYRTVNIGSGSEPNWVTYAIRFRGTKFESAWRYEYKKADEANGGNRFIIKNVMLWKGSDKNLIQDDEKSVATEEFFKNSNTTERVFPLYGQIHAKYNEADLTSPSSDIGSLHQRYHNWGRNVLGWKSASRFSVYLEEAYSAPTYRVYGFCLRPFARH